ncbi:MAG: aminotransferase class I/II-fold pyridoxal phosphate-dependent enzyme [Alphaproteobacteria bacterium]|nr:aminotransferase class I/II-fold pyridoxal phosphate-dependent enzyme [Alphaproteobacteria bacterium]
MRDTASSPLPFIDLQAQRSRISDQIDAAIRRVLDHGAFIMGPEVTDVERQLADRTGAAHCLTCASGTDALILPLMAADIGPGDAVLVPSFTFTSSAEVVALRGATPVFVDVDPQTFNIDADSLKSGLRAADSAGVTAKALMTVDLFGQPADFDPIREIADEHGLWILDDAAQAFGATYKGSSLGTLGRVTGTSFYPSKPLSCYGDGGAILTDDTELYERMKSVRVHGNGGGSAEAKCLGLTARFDSIQAAILLEKLKIFDDECEKRNVIAQRYSEGLSDVVQTPQLIDDVTSVWAQYTLVSEQRNTIVETLAADSIPTALFYPLPLHIQGPYRNYPVAGNGLPVTERLANQVVSLPMHPYLEADAQARIIAAVRTALAS